jgi:hypothetical protein
MSRTRVCLLAGEPRGRERACCCRYDCRHDPSGDARQRSGTTRLGAHPWMLRLYPHAAHVSGYSSAAPSPPCQTSSHQEEAHQQPFRPFSSQPTDCGRSPGRRPRTLSSHGVRRPSPPPSASPSRPSRPPSPSRLAPSRCWSHRRLRRRRRLRHRPHRARRRHRAGRAKDVRTSRAMSASPVRRQTAERPYAGSSALRPRAYVAA